MTTSPVNDGNPQRKDKVISVRFSENEYKGLQERARKERVSISDYIRQRMELAPIYYNINQFTSTPCTYATGTSIVLTNIPN